MFVALYEHGMQRPIEIVARTDARHFQSFQRVEHSARSNGNPSSAQRPREINDVFGEPAGIRITSPLEGEVGRCSEPGGG